MTGSLQSDRPGRNAPGRQEFPDTRWSQVSEAGHGERAAAGQALEQLCRSYWLPIYSFLRRKGYSPHDAEDLTQQFFVRLLQSNSVASADRSKGRFRTFLLGALHHYLTDEYRKMSAQKRRGALLPFSVDFAEAEATYAQVPDPDLTPEQLYDRRWGEALLGLAFDQLAAEFSAAGQDRRFEQLKPFLASQPAEGKYDQLAAQMHMTARAVGTAVYRMRQRYRELVRRQVADTVAQADDVDAELHHIFDGLR